MSVMVSYVDCGWTWKKKNCCNNLSTGLGMHSADHSSVFGGEGAGLSLCQFSESYLKVWILRMAQIVVMVVSSEFWVSRLSDESVLWCRGLVHVPSIHCCRNLGHVFQTSHLWRRSCVHEFWTSQQSTLYAEALSWTSEQSPSHWPCAEALHVCLEQVNKWTCFAEHELQPVRPPHRGSCSICVPPQQQLGAVSSPFHPKARLRREARGGLSSCFPEQSSHQWWSTDAASALVSMSERITWMTVCWMCVCVCVLFNRR